MLTQLVHNTKFRRIPVIVLSGILTHILSVVYLYQKQEKLLDQYRVSGLELSIVLTKLSNAEEHLFGMLLIMFSPHVCTHLRSTKYRAYKAGMYIG